MLKHPEDIRDSLRIYFGGSTRETERRPLKPLALGTLFSLAGISVYLILGAAETAFGCALFLVIPAILCFTSGLSRLLWSWMAQKKRQSIVATGPTDEEVQGRFDDAVERIKEYALRALGIVGEEELRSEITPFVSPVLWPMETLGNEYRLTRTGTDGRARFGAYAITFLLLTEERLCIFHCKYNFIIGEILDSEASELRYKDIVSVSTAEGNRPIALPSGEKLSKVRELRLSVANRDAIRLVIDIPELWQIAGADAPPTDVAEKTIRAIRRMMP